MLERLAIYNPISAFYYLIGLNDSLLTFAPATALIVWRRRQKSGIEGFETDGVFTPIRIFF